MLDDGFADALGHGRAAGDGDAMRFRAGGDDVDEIVVAQHVGEFEQRLRHLDLVIGELVDDIARRAFQRREQLGDMRARLDLDQLGELAQHLVILRDLLVVAAIRDVGIELRHVAEQLVALGDVGIAVQDPEGRKGALAVFHFLRHVSDTPRLLPLRGKESTAGPRIASRQADAFE